MTNLEWYKVNDCSHAHCKYECEHPQPFMLEDRLICGRCYILDNEVSEMIPCNSKTCKD